MGKEGVGRDGLRKRRKMKLIKEKREKNEYDMEMKKRSNR
jgi:hypothetical protein